LEQPKKPGANKDIADLKARLGLLKSPAGQPGAAPSPFPPSPAASPFPGPPPAAAPFPGAPPGAAGRGRPAAQSAVAPVPMAPPAPDPYASLKPQPGRFDMRPVDDAGPVANVKSKGGKMLLVFLVAGAVGGALLGYGFGEGGTGRRNMNTTNRAARTIKTELEEMQKTVSQIGQAVAFSQQRNPKDPTGYDAKLIEDLEKVKLDPRPDTNRIFKTNYAMLENLAVDRLMNYYYDSIALYGEVERHIKRSKADKAELEAFAAKQNAQGSGTYGVVFDSRGKLVIASLVEVGKPVCKGGGEENCPLDQIEGFQIRSNTGAPWTTRKIAPKPAGDIVAPLDRTPLLETVMAGSPEQVRYEQYRQRYNSIRLILARLAGGKKDLFEAIDKAAQRPDVFDF
jgi:hypothetical protein